MTREATPAHLLSRWGEPARRATFEGQDLSIEILKWDAEATGEGVDIYVTVGSGIGNLKNENTAKHRTEFLLGLHPAQDAVVGSLASLGIYELKVGATIKSGDTVPSDGPLWPGTEMMAFLILEQEEIIPKSQLSDGSHVHFLQAIPLHESELIFKRSYGVEALMGWWEDNMVPFWDPNRGPAVPDL